MKDKTDKQIANELAALKDLAPRIRQRSAFGDDNRANIEAQIEVLEDFMSESEIYDKEESGDWGQDTVSSAIEALNWMNGEEDEALSKGWEVLAK